MKIANQTINGEELILSKDNEVVLGPIVNWVSGKNNALSEMSRNNLESGFRHGAVEII